MASTPSVSKQRELGEKSIPDSQVVEKTGLPEGQDAATKMTEEPSPPQQTPPKLFKAKYNQPK